MWKKALLGACALFAAAAVSACGSGQATSSKDAAMSAAPKDPSAVVVYWSATGNTEKVAKNLAEATGANLYKVEPVQPYTQADLDYNNQNSRCYKEHQDPSIRPEIKDNIQNWDQYKTVYIGYPIWWGQAPALMYTFVEHHNFDGKTVIPFCTAYSSPIGDSGDNLAKAAKTGNWKEGDRLEPSDSVQNLAAWAKKVVQ